MLLIDHPHPPRTLRRRELARFLADASARVRLPAPPAVLVTTSERMGELNRQFRRKNKPTDVLSFPSGDPQLPGDLAISLDIALAQAAELGHPLADELRILLLHGLLHLAGYDHETDSGEMARREARLRRLYGLPVTLIQRSAAAAPPRVTARARAASR
jgi:probable rRNA maturation factor